MKWLVDKEYLVGIYKLKSFNFSKKNNIAGFDLDSTLIKTKSNKIHATDKDDWKFLYPNVPPNLKKLHKDGYQVVIFTNQKGIAKPNKDGNDKIEPWKEKVENIVKLLNIPIIVLVSLAGGMYRKPSTSLWDKYIKYDKEKSFYVGDAFGRGPRQVNKQYTRKDFADTDLKFGKNLGVKCYSPEKFFQKIDDIKYYTTNYPINLEKQIIETSRLGKTITRKLNGTYQPFKPLSQKDGQCMVILCGFPGSGKSYYSKKYIEPYGYVRINRDTLKTIPKCIRKCRDELDKNNSVIIDNTNPSIKSRKDFIDLAKEYNIPCRMIRFTTSMDLSMHNSGFRNVILNGARSHIPIMVYRIWNKQFEVPSKTEGFTHIMNIDFAFEDNKHTMEKYYKYYY